MQKRIEYIDISKGIAILCIIIGHLSITSVNRIVFTFHIPIFLLITGYFLNEKLSLSMYIKKQARSIMLPYLATCITIIFLGTLKGAVIGNPLQEFLNWVYASAYGSGASYDEPFWIYRIGAIWYLPAAFLGSILLKWVMRFKESIRMIIIITLFFIGDLTAQLLFWFPMSIQSGMCCALFMYVGWLYRHHEKELSELGNEVKLFFTVFSFAVWISFIIQYPGFSIVIADFGRGVVDIFGSICASWCVLKISKVIVRKASILKKLFLFSGRYSLLILCVHIVEQDLFPWHSVLTRILYIPEIAYRPVLLIIKPTIDLIIVWLLLRLSFVKKIFQYKSIKTI